MNKGTAVHAAFDAHYGAIASPFSDLAARSGGTKQAAALLGVSQRTVQRRIVAEGNAPKGGKQARGVGASKAARSAAVAAKGKPARANFAGDVNINAAEFDKKYQGYRDSFVDDLPDAFWEACIAGDWDAAADVIADVYVGESEFEDLDEFSLE